MNWVIVVIDGDDILVMGDFDTKEAAEKYVEIGYGNYPSLRTVHVRPVLMTLPLTHYA